ncbi:hypothetical protein [Quatrionicoccus australiensis]|uniref:hypothetical protein n=1 Tax=Quatrionicoccus australiensis TaxID=138118 RepID=UPI001CFA6AB7|nr:hypothetical protein [Quatrionicoccus australiensis]MCB4359560.1 hypothetical protein [Quatrionicoccus australiensis]
MTQAQALADKLTAAGITVLNVAEPRLYVNGQKTSEREDGVAIRDEDGNVLEGDMKLAAAGGLTLDGAYVLVPYSGTAPRVCVQLPGAQWRIGQPRDSIPALVADIKAAQQQGIAWQG